MMIRQLTFGLSLSKVSSDSKEFVCNAGEPSFYPWVRKIPWRRGWNSLQYSCLENLLDRGVCQATVRGVTKSRT